MPDTLRHPAGTPTWKASTGRLRSASVGLLSTYPPTQCGLATFSAALRDHLDRSPGDVGVVRVVDHPESHPGSEVVGHLVNGRAGSTAQAAALLNGFDVVVLQHEYGIFGGPDGIDVLDVVDRVTSPLVVVLHTVLQDPTPGQRHILLRLLAAANVVVTMTETARRRLIRTYGADPGQVAVIPHGAIEHDVDAGTQRATDRPVVLTWGLLGPGKGIEWAIDAMADLRDLRPRYLVVGKTHPKVLERDGEAYRSSLVAQTAARGLEDVVELDASYLGLHELAALVQSADVVLLPYDSPDQVTSGVLIEAVAAGRPVVSTAFPHAIELLTDGAGLVVPQRDPAALSAALRRVLSEPGLADEMAAHAAKKAPGLFWRSVAASYQKLADRLAAAALVAAS